MKQTFVLCVLLFACGPGGRHGDDDDDDSQTCPRCSADKESIIDCNGNAKACPPEQLCTEAEGPEGNVVCLPACEAADANHASVGCDYYAVDMDGASGPPQDGCFAVFIANTSRGRMHMNISWSGGFIDLSRFAKIPQGQGQSLTYGAYNPGDGLMPGQVAIVFLAYAAGGTPFQPSVRCPVDAAIGTDAQFNGTGTGTAFHIETDMPIVAYQMLPYGGGAAAATGASLLLPTSSWQMNYIAVTAYDTAMPPPLSVPQGPSLNIVAKEDATMVTIRPKSNVLGGGGLPAGTAEQPYVFTLDKGKYAQITQSSPMSGSPITADKPIGVFGGADIIAIDRCCGDHAEQMMPPVKALGWEYVAAPHADRRPVSEERIYRIFGTVDDTQLTYDPPNLGPTTIKLGQWFEIRSATPFTVKSQDDGHPFAMFTYMSGSGEVGEGGQGDSDFVRMVPPKQFMQHYVFFTDPTYPFTTLTVVRKKHSGSFRDVELQCIGNISGWQPVGTSGDYEIAFIKIVDHWASQNGCNNGVQIMDSDEPFGVWVWGWGSEDTNTGWVSYGYPAGEGILPINDVIIL
jgi:hypothetical protein